MYPTDITVAAIVSHAGRYLMIEERARGRDVLTQPGGHIENRESPEQAVEREALEESGCIVSCNELVGVYLWIHPQTRQQFLRLAYAADFVHCDEARKLDDGVHRRLWLTREQIESRRDQLRTPTVLRCIDDFEAGKRESAREFTRMLPLTKHVDAVIARANLI